MTDDDAGGPAPTDMVDSECLGSFPSLAAFVRVTLEPQLPRGLRWLLDCLDLERVLHAMTGGGRDRLRVVGGWVWLDRRADDP